MKKKQLSAVHYKARPKKLQKLRNSIISPPCHSLSLSLSRSSSLWCRLGLKSNPTTAWPPTLWLRPLQVKGVNAHLSNSDAAHGTTITKASRRQEAGGSSSSNCGSRKRLLLLVWNWYRSVTSVRLCQKKVWERQFMKRFDPNNNNNKSSRGRLRNQWRKMWHEKKAEQVSGAKTKK